MRIRLADITGFSRLAFASLKTKLYQSKKRGLKMAQKKKWLKAFIHSPIGAWIMAIILILMVKIIWATCRVRHVNPPKLLRKQHPPKPTIITHWHEYIIYTLMLSPPWVSVLN